MVEFTGERLIPGQVSEDLLNEHMARYAFAARLAGGKRVLDAGCGAGYGSAELAHVAAAVIGADNAADALAFARENYRLPNLHFERAACEALPHPDATFDLVVAFEVIEHLERWPEFLLEVRRVLSPDGQFVVSTPNKAYYTESRGRQGANPFHVHEFEFEEFRSELLSVFPEVALFLENHVEGVAFQPDEAAAGVDVHVNPGRPAPREAHFFVAVASHRALPPGPLYLYVPRAGNVLRERGRHIELLEEELATKNAWLERALGEHEALVAAHRQQKEELERSNRWAENLNGEIERCRAKVKELEEDILAKVQWARDLENRLEDRVKELALAVDMLHRTEKELEDRTAWARRLEQEKRQVEDQLALVRASRWMKAGRKLGLGPELPG
ncbi:MAG TPA: methyltransferase domain-containing protein [Bryobacteraceae bacterium]|nr:methyltransferase domain-containing protein [Bryobacteraceae bacterium]